MTDVHVMYGLADGNWLQAERFWIVRFPSRNITSRKIFENIHRRFYFYQQGLPLRRIETEETLPHFLDNVPLAPRIWFMHDGAPIHFSLIPRYFSTSIYGDQWISLGRPHAWHAQLPDLNFQDFFYMWISEVICVFLFGQPTKSDNCWVHLNWKRPWCVLKSTIVNDEITGCLYPGWKKLFVHFM